MAFQLLALTGMWASCVSLFNGDKSRKTQSELETKRRETQLEMEYLRMNHQANLESTRQAFQKKVVEYQCENSLRVQQFVKTVDLMLAKNQQEFQAWQAEQQRKLQQELAVYNRETQLAVAAYQRETTKGMAEFNKILDNWPLRLYPSEIIGSPSQEKAVPLRIIIAPPEIDYDRFGVANKDFPKLEKRLAQGVRGFMENHYPLNSQERPTEFLGGAWDSNRFHSEASIKRLFTMLKSEPTLILESEVDGEYINLRLAYWSGGQDLYGYKTVISRLAHLEMVKAFAKERIWQSKPDKESPKDVKIEHNAKDFEKFCEFLVACHQLLAGLFADVHYLIHYNRPLQLPSLLPEVIKSFPDHQVAKEMIQWIVNGYRDAFKVLEMDRSYWIPDLMLELAQGLAGLEDKSWARELVEESGREWLRLRGISLINGDILESMKPILIAGDKDYLCRLENCFSSLENKQAIVQTKSLISLVEEKIRLESELENQRKKEEKELQKRELEKKVTEESTELKEAKKEHRSEETTRCSVRKSKTVVEERQNLAIVPSGCPKVEMFKSIEQSKIELPKKEKIMAHPEEENFSGQRKSSSKEEPNSAGFIEKWVGEPLNSAFNKLDQLTAAIRNTLGSTRSLKPLALFTYEDAIQYFVDKRPRDPRVEKGAILRQLHQDGHLIIQVFLDVRNSLVFDGNGQLYGRQLLTKNIDEELRQAFGNTSMILVE
jgi:hypothetical protein